MVILSLLFTFITIYAVLKERQEHGCVRSLWSIEKQCNEDESVYIKGTEPSQTDSNSMLKAKLDSVLSYHEKGAVWRKCWIMSLILSIVLYILLRANLKSVDELSLYWLLLSIQITSFFLMYFFFNYINYHHFRRLKNNGLLILDEVFKRCKI